jgi:hypothetical protein
MKVDEKGGLKNDRQGHRAPDGDGEKQTAVKSSSENCDAEAHDECVKAGDADRCEEVKQTRPDITARTFRPPGAGRFFLEPMKDNAHPEPAHENGNDPGDETGDERGAKRVHRCESSLSILARATAIVQEGFGQPEAKESNCVHCGKTMHGGHLEWLRYGCTQKRACPSLPLI